MQAAEPDTDMEVEASFASTPPAEFPMPGTAHPVVPEDGVPKPTTSTSGSTTSTTSGTSGGPAITLCDGNP